MSSMNFDDQIRRYFGTSDLASVPPSALEAGIEHMKVDLGLTKDRGDRFALWHCSIRLDLHLTWMSHLRARRIDKRHETSWT